MKIRRHTGTGRRRTAVRGLSLLVALAATASCSSPTPRHGQPPRSSAAPAPTVALSGAQLRQRLMTQDALPPGFDTLDFGDDDGPSDEPASSPTPAPAASPVDALPCDDLTGHELVYDLGTSTGEAHLGVHGSAGSGWFGTEWLDSYPGDGAARVLDDLRSVVKRCPSFGDEPLDSSGSSPLQHTVSLVPGPKLGDESLRLEIRTPSRYAGATVEADSIYVRYGTVLLLFNEQTTIATGTAPSPLERLAAAAVAKLDTGS